MLNYDWQLWFTMTFCDYTGNDPMAMTVCMAGSVRCFFCTAICLWPCSYPLKRDLINKSRAASHLKCKYYGFSLSLSSLYSPCNPHCQLIFSVRNQGILWILSNPINRINPEIKPINHSSGAVHFLVWRRVPCLPVPRGWSVSTGWLIG